MNPVNIINIVLYLNSIQPSHVKHTCDRGGDNHGGKCVYTKDNVFSRRRNDLELPNIECILIEITVHHRKFLLGTFYRPSNSPAQNFVFYRRFNRSCL